MNQAIPTTKGELHTGVNIGLRIVVAYTLIPAGFSLWLRLRRVWDELDYAQKRLLEINSGQILTEDTRRRAARAQVRELNALLELEIDTTSADADDDTCRGSLDR